MTRHSPSPAYLPWVFWGIRSAALAGLLVAVSWAAVPVWLAASLAALVCLPLRSLRGESMVPVQAPDLGAFTRDISRSTSANAVAAAGVAWAVKQMAARAQSQAQAAQQVVDDGQAMIATVQGTEALSAQARPAAEYMLADGRAGHAVLEHTITRMQRLSQHAGSSRESIAVLGELGDGIARVAATIASIAGQTNLLALNAAIEAARAGEHGRGFAVVADEVRALAARTAQATDEVGQMVGQIQQRTADVVVQIDRLADELQAGVVQVGEAGQMMTRIAGQASQVASQVGDIAVGASSNLERLASLFQAIDGMRGDLAANQQRIEQLGTAASQLEHQAETLSERLAAGGLDDYHQRIYDLAREGAEAIAQRFEADVAAGVITQQALFDRSLKWVPGTEPAKYQSAFDRYTDQVLPALQEPLLARHEGLVFAIACTPQGYVPTHNRAFSQPPSGDIEKDRALSRSKRKFDDPTGIRCGSHQQPLLLQTYCRDTGELMHDLSVPIQCLGKHWGGLRLGYRPQT